MAKQSAGILFYRRHGRQAEVLLVHLDGPFWAKKDVWSIPKGEPFPEEDHLSAAKREFLEETGLEPPADGYEELGEAKQSGGKVNHIWINKNDMETAGFRCTSMVKLEWPPRSGKVVEFPEVDRLEWMEMNEAKQKLFKNQTVFIDRLAEKLGLNLAESEPKAEQASLF